MVFSWPSRTKKIEKEGERLIRLANIQNKNKKTKVKKKKEKIETIKEIVELKRALEASQRLDHSYHWISNRALTSSTVPAFKKDLRECKGHIIKAKKHSKKIELLSKKLIKYLPPSRNEKTRTQGLTDDERQIFDATEKISIHLTDLVEYIDAFQSLPIEAAVGTGHLPPNNKELADNIIERKNKLQVTIENIFISVEKLFMLEKEHAEGLKKADQDEYGPGF